MWLTTADTLTVIFGTLTTSAAALTCYMMRNHTISRAPSSSPDLELGLLPRSNTSTSSETHDSERIHERESLDNGSRRTQQMIGDALEIFSRHLRSRD